MTLIVLAGVKKLSSQQSGEEEGIDSQSYNLNINELNKFICLVTNLQPECTLEGFGSSRRQEGLRSYF